jgi:hypothetical protein
LIAQTTLKWYEQNPSQGAQRKPKENVKKNKGDLLRGPHCAPHPNNLPAKNTKQF